MTMFQDTSVRCSRVYDCEVTGINPEGAAFLGLIDTLIDLVRNPAVSRIEVIMSSFALDERGEKKLMSGKASILERSFVVRHVNKDVREKLREQLDAGPVTCLMILWMERFENGNKMGIQTFDPAIQRKRDHAADYDDVEKSAISGYLHRLTKK